MPPEKNSVPLTLTETEATELLSVSGGTAGQQQMQAQLKEQLADGNRTLHLTDPQLGKLVRFMATGPSAVKQVLKRSFHRPLLELINKA